jgi:hypothetical protein
VESSPTEAIAPQPEEISSRERRRFIAIRFFESRGDGIRT